MANTAKITIIFVIIGVIAIVLGYAFWPHNKALAPTDAVSTSTAPADSAKTNLPTPSPQSKLDQCVVEVKASANYPQAASGLIIVSFTKGTSFEQAIAILKSQSLSVADTTETRDSYLATGFFEVSVPEGEEVKWICALREVLGIRNTSLDVLFNIHE